MKTRIIFSIAFTLCSLFASAHALWIETDSRGAKGKAHSAAIYFGEYAGNERDTVAGWFSNLKDVQLFVTVPDGTKKQVALKDATDHYTGSFTPETDGAYILSVAHTVADIYGNAKIEYYATATVFVGAASNTALKTATHVSIVPAAEMPQSRKETPVTVYSSGAALTAAKVVVASPEGWVKTTQSDQAGRAVFTPLGEGRYMLEAVLTDKTPGMHNGKPYQAVTHLVTHCVYVR
jgi:hypothetical protein